MLMNEGAASGNPMPHLDDWEESLTTRYPQPNQKAREDYRNYDNPGRDTVRDFYRMNHRFQTFDLCSRRKSRTCNSTIAR